MKTLLASTAALALACAAGSAFANTSASKDEAVAMVKKGISYIKANGTDKGYAAITGKDKQFVDRDLYLVVYGLDGKCLAHGANEKQVGKDLIESWGGRVELIQFVDGKSTTNIIEKILQSYQE